MEHHLLHSLLKNYSSTTGSSIPQPDVEVFFYYNNLHIIEGLARVAFINPGGSSFTVPAPPPPVVPARWPGGAANNNVGNQTYDDCDSGDEETSCSGSDSDGDVRSHTANGLTVANEAHELEDEQDSSSVMNVRVAPKLQYDKTDRRAKKNAKWTVYAAVETHHPLPLLFMRSMPHRKKKLPLTPRPSKAPSTATASVQFNTTLTEVHEPIVRNNSQRLFLLNPQKYGVTYVAPAEVNEQDDVTTNSASDLDTAVHYQQRMSLINNTWASSPALPDIANGSSSGTSGPRNVRKPTTIPRPQNFPTANSLTKIGVLQRQNTLKLIKDTTTNHYYDLTRQNSANLQQNGGQHQRQRRSSVKPVAPPHSPPRFGPFRAFHIRKHNSINNAQQQQQPVNGGGGFAASNNQWQQQSSVNGGGFGTYDDVHHSASLYSRRQSAMRHSPSYSNMQPLLSTSPLLTQNIGIGGAAAVYTERGIFGLVEELSLLPAAAAALPPPKPEPLLRLLDPRTSSSSSGVKQSGSRGSILLMQSRMRGRRMSKPSILNQLIARSECRSSNRHNDARAVAAAISETAASSTAYRTTPQVKATVEQPFLIVTMFGSTQSETASKRFENNWFNTTLAHYVLNNIPKTFRLRCVRFLRRKTTFLTAPPTMLNNNNNNNNNEQSGSENDMLTNYYAGGSGYYQQQQQLQQQQRMQTIQYICTIEVIPTASSILAYAVNLKIDLVKQNECELLREILTAELLNFVIKLRAFYVGIVGVYECVKSKPKSSPKSSKRQNLRQQQQQQQNQAQEESIPDYRLLVEANVHGVPQPTTPSPTTNEHEKFSGKYDFSNLLASDERRRSSMSSGSWQMLRQRFRKSNNNPLSQGSVESLGGVIRREPPLELLQQNYPQYGGSATQVHKQQQHNSFHAQQYGTSPQYMMRSDQQIYQQQQQPQHPGVSAGRHSSRMNYASPTLTAMYVEDERSPFGGSLMQRLAAVRRQEQQAKQQQQQQAQKKKHVPASVPIGLRRLDSGEGAGSDNDSERRHRGGAVPWAFPFYGGKWKMNTPH